MRLSKPQKNLLEELQEAKGAWCECMGSEYRTAKALQNMGLIEISEEWGPVKTHDDRFEARSMAGQILQSQSDPTVIYEMGENGNRWRCQVQPGGVNSITQKEAAEIAAKIVEALNEWRASQ